MLFSFFAVGGHTAPFSVLTTEWGAFLLDSLDLLRIVLEMGVWWLLLAKTGRIRVTDEPPDDARDRLVLRIGERVCHRELLVVDSQHHVPFAFAHALSITPF